MSAAGRPVSEGDLVAYVDGELDLTRCREIEGFAGQDPSLAAQIDVWRRQDELLRAAFARVAAEPVPAALAGRSRDLPTGTPGVTGAAPLRITTADRTRVMRLRRERQTRLVAAILVAFLSGAIVTFVAARLLTRGQPVMVPTVSLSTAPILPDAARRLALRALETDLAFAGRESPPPDVPGSDRVRVAGLMQSLLGGADTGAHTEAPDLSPLGLRLVGARIAPGEQAPAIWLLYDGTAGEKVSLFATRLVSPESTPRYEEGPTAGTIFWTTSQHGFAVTGSRDRDRLARIASDIRAQVPQAR